MKGKYKVGGGGDRLRNNWIWIIKLESNIILKKN